MKRLNYFNFDIDTIQTLMDYMYENYIDGFDFTFYFERGDDVACGVEFHNDNLLLDEEIIIMIDVIGVLDEEDYI